MDSSGPYYRQVQLLIRLLPIIGRETCFALKGGTALNLFVRDMPRLSVDIDLVYLPVEDRDTTLANVQAALQRIADAIGTKIPGSKVTWTNAKDSLRLFVEANGVNVKIELSPVLRGSVHKPVTLTVRPAVEEEFGYAEVPVLALPDLYAGKICAALDRQHPRDLFDIKLLLENEGLTDDIRRTFLVYLISHNRQMAELLAPNRKDIRAIFVSEFQSMTMHPVIVEELEEAREQLIRRIHTDLTDEERRFLLSFKSKAPEWELLGFTDTDKLPAVRWKMINLEKMPQERHAAALGALRKAIGMD